MIRFARTGEIDRWCADQMRPWEDRCASLATFSDTFDDLNASSATVFLFDFDGGEVTMRAKSVAHLPAPERAKHEAAVPVAGLYHRLFGELVRDGLRIRTSVALDVYDISQLGRDVPVFCFQKTAGDRNILLPDVDFFWHRWYHRAWAEPRWARKRPLAFFAGSSTGGNLLTLHDVLTDRPERLAWARAALGSARIDFRICDAVQCDTPETAAALAAQPYFKPVALWEEHLEHRYLLSLDGNGATCSRVVRTLASRSILLKTRSDHQLYYFDGLRPYEHHVPVTSIAEVEQAVDDLEAGRIDRVAINRAANRFCRAYLRRDRVLLYLRTLLERYGRTVAA